MNFEKTNDEKLCEIIVASRYLGSMKMEAIAAMEELARRRQNGSDYPFETKIEEKMKLLPVFNTSISNIFKGTF